MLWSRRASRADIDRVLRAAYPTRVLEDLDFDALDQQLPLDRLPELVERLSSGGRSTAAIEPEIVKAHILHVGRPEYPDWLAFNRDLSRSERIAVIEGAGGELVFWNILLSRVGPFWTAFWNTFRRRQGRAVPEMTAQPADFEWQEIMHAVQVDLTSFGMLEVDGRLCEESVQWMRRTHDDANEGGVPTVRDTLFSEIY